MDKYRALLQLVQDTALATLLILVLVTVVGQVTRNVPNILATVMFHPIQMFAALMVPALVPIRALAIPYIVVQCVNLVIATVFQDILALYALVTAHVIHPMFVHVILVGLERLVVFQVASV
jgi:hypothetical protein